MISLGEFIPRRPYEFDVHLLAAPDSAVTWSFRARSAREGDVLVLNNLAPGDYRVYLKNTNLTED